MNNLKQIELITHSFKKKKEFILFELYKVTANIYKKENLIKKMQSYLNDYVDFDKFHLSRTTPILNRNIELFIQNIENVIQQTQVEINELDIKKQSILHKIGALDKKIKVMDLFTNRELRHISLKIQHLEQLMLDDLTSTRHLRNEND